MDDSPEPVGPYVRERVWPTPEAAKPSASLNTRPPQVDPKFAKEDVSEPPKRVISINDVPPQAPPKLKQYRRWGGLEFVRDSRILDDAANTRDDLSPQRKKLYETSQHLMWASSANYKRGKNETIPRPDGSSGPIAMPAATTTATEVPPDNTATQKPPRVLPKYARETTRPKPFKP